MALSMAYYEFHEELNTLTVTEKYAKHIPQTVNRREKKNYFSKQREERQNTTRYFGRGKLEKKNTESTRQVAKCCKCKAKINCGYMRLTWFTKSDEPLPPANTSSTTNNNNNSSMSTSTSTVWKPHIDFITTAAFATSTFRLHGKSFFTMIISIILLCFSSSKCGK